MDEDRLAQLVARLQQRQMLVDEMNVPGPLDLRNHHDVELVADLGDDAGEVVEQPRRIQRVDAHPEAGRAEIDGLRHRDEALARRFLGLDRNRILEIAEHDVDLRGEFADLGAHLLVVRRHEMDHALQPRRQFAERRRRADGERLEKFPRRFHGHPLVPRRLTAGARKGQSAAGDSGARTGPLQGP